MGEGGGGAKYKKNIRARENFMKKNSCTPINPKKYSCYGLKKIHTRNLIIPLPPITFLMPRPLTRYVTVWAKTDIAQTTLIMRFVGLCEGRQDK